MPSNTNHLVLEAAQTLARRLKERLVSAVQCEANGLTLKAVMELKEFTRGNLTDIAKVHKQGVAHILPEGTRFVKCGKNVALAIEQKPCIRSLMIDDRLNSRLIAGDMSLTAGHHKSLVPLALPHIIFLLLVEPLASPRHFSFKGLRVFFRNEPIRKPEDVLCHTILPNMSSVICMGHSWSGAVGTLIEVAEKAITHWWTSGFTMDYTSHWKEVAAKHSQLVTLKTWAENTKTDPDFILKIEWSPAAKLCDVMDEDLGIMEVQPLDVEFINKFTKQFERDIAGLVEKASKLDASVIDQLALAFETALGEPIKKKVQEVEEEKAQVAAAYNPVP